MTGASNPVRHTTAITAAIFMAIGVLAACSGDDDAPTTSSPIEVTIGEDVADLTGQDAVEVQVRDNSFNAQHIAISTGTTVTFANKGRNPHNVVSVEEGAFPEVPTDSLQPGDAATVTFDEPGEYPYYCSLHGTDTAGMTGSIVVTD